MFKILKKFVYKGEFLEFNLEDKIKNHKNMRLIFFYVFFKKVLRNIYRIFQRSLIKPSIRSKFSYFEVKTINFFKKNFFYNCSFSKKECVTSLNKNAFCIIDNLLTEEQINNIKNYLLTKKKFNIIEESTNKKMEMDYYSTEDLIANKEILNVINNEKLIEIIRGYFKCDFKLDWIWSWWSYANVKSESVGPQLFHRDYENLNFLKLFIYLTDVEGEDGSHQIIKGSNKIDFFYKISRFSDEEIYSKFKEKDCSTIDGKTGKSFLANTYAIHRGLRPHKKDRLVLCYLLSLYPSRRSPKLPPINYSEIKDNKKSYLKNKNIYDLFINFNK